MAKKTASILDGRTLGEALLCQAKVEIASLKEKKGVTLRLATLRAGQSDDAVLYEKYLTKLLARVGVQHESCVLPADSSVKSILAHIHQFNQNENITGIMVFAPLPKNVNPAEVFDHVHQSKDVEGRTFLKSHFGVFSPTANAVITLIESTKIPLAGKEAVVVGHSDLVGKPTAVLLLDRMATVTVCHKETKDLRAHIKKADVLVSAVGKAHLIQGSWIKPGAIVIDVGENILKGKLVGDVDFESAKKRAAFITPVPGGVGPVTDLILIKNLIRLHELQVARNGNR